jgi:hypothetical protein
VTYSNNSETPTPYIRPKLNFSDCILVKNALQLLKENLIPELQERADLIIEKIEEEELKR